MDDGQEKAPLLLRKLREEAKKRKWSGSEGYGEGSGGVDDAAEQAFVADSTAVQSRKKKTRILPSPDLEGRRTSGGSGMDRVDGDGTDGMDIAGVPPTPKERCRDGSSSVSGGSNGEMNEGGKDPREPPDTIAEEQPEARTGGVVIAYTPNMPRRYGYLLRDISFLLPCESQGHAFECPCNKIDAFLRWSGCKTCLFFEWVEKRSEDAISDA